MTEVMKWEEQMAKEAEVAAKQEEGVAGGQFFSLKGGRLSWMDNELPNNEMAVIILDSVLENVFYEGAYNPDNVQSPTCFAFGRDAKTMAPSIDDPVSKVCEGCPKNEWGSADTGRGKACSNVRRLAMIPAGELKETFEMYDDFEATEGYMKLNVMSVKGYANYVTQLANTIHRPPYGVVTRVKVVPDNKSQFRVTFEAMQELDGKVMPTIMKRHEEVASIIDFPYQVAEVTEKPKNKKY